MSTSQPDTDGTRRAGIIAGLRALADFYAANPDLPLPRYPEWRHCVAGGDDLCGASEVAAIAAALDAPVANGVHIEARHRFGPIEFHVFYCPVQAMADYNARTSYANVIQVEDPR